jgi:hypothetical protein
MLKWLGRRCFLTSWWGLALLLVVAGSGTTAAAASADRQELEVRAKRYWAAETSQNYEAVYEMLTPGERDAMSRDEYLALRKVGGVRYLAAELVEFAYDRELAWVYVKYDWVFASHAYAAPKSGSSWQLWRHDDGTQGLAYTSAEASANRRGGCACRTRHRVLACQGAARLEGSLRLFAALVSGTASAREIPREQGALHLFFASDRVGGSE